MAVKGAILGDILGSQYEFERPDNLDYLNVPVYNEENCEFTDDTVMTLAIKKAILEEKDLTETMVKIGSRYPFCGYGGNFFEWINGTNHEPYGSWGNGSAMRIAFIGEYFEELDKVKEMAEKSAAVSHNHPEGIKGAVVSASCIWMAKHGKSKDEIYEYVLKEYPKEEYDYSIAKSLDEIRGKYVWDVSCQGSVPVAMRCFYESSDFESFMRNIYSLSCDTDTLGAIAGGVAEEFYHGFGNIDADGIIKDKLTPELYDILIL